MDIDTYPNGMLIRVQLPVNRAAGSTNALGQPSPHRTDFSGWSRQGLEEFARQAADENLVLRHDLKVALEAWRAAVAGKGS
jgi:hypothetical protein